MKKKQRNRKFGGSKEPVETRGFTVVSTSTGKRPYLPVPGGITEKEATRLAAGLVDCEAVPINH